MKLPLKMKKMTNNHFVSVRRDKLVDNAWKRDWQNETQEGINIKEYEKKTGSTKIDHNELGCKQLRELFSKQEADMSDG
jgi:hypothetical protein